MEPEDGRGGGGRVDVAAPDSIVSSMAKLSCHDQDEEDDTAATATNTNTNTNTNAVSTELKNEDPLSILKMIQKLDETIAVLQQPQSPPLTSSSSTIPTSLPMELLTHYHHIPPSVQQIYDTLLQGATLIHGTVTKYTLMGQMEQNNNNCSTAQIPYLQDLLQGCRMVTACVMTMHHPPLGCSRSVQNHTRTAVRAIVRSVVQLIQVFVVDAVDHHGNHHQHHASLPAQRTGVVWEACTVLLEKKLPVGNRNAMRRDLFTYRMESNVTIQEFQALLLTSPSEQHHYHPTDDDHHNNEQEEEDDDEDIEDCYSVSELPIAVACVGILKCSRGTINVAMDAMDRIGMSISPPPSSLQEDRTNTTTTIAGGSGTNDAVGVTNKNNISNNNDGEDQNHARWICTSTLHDLACQVGYGVTDLGASLYPPLVLQTSDDSKKDVGALQVKDDTITTAAVATTTAVADNNDNNTLYQEVRRQSDAVRRVLQFIVDIHSKYDLSSTTTTTSADTNDTSIMNVVRNLQNAIELRTHEADGAITTALSPTTIPPQQQQPLKEGI
jgi:hypothetical protein